MSAEWTWNASSPNNDAPTGTPGGSAFETEPPAANLDPGSVIEGRYTILGLLGRGGMGVVYRARDDQAGRDVAVKVLLESGEAPRERFSREGAVTASLVHPGIIRVHAHGFAGASPYLVYELVEDAQTLDDVLPASGLRRRVELIRDAARALAAAHARGVVHRDVKPANLLIDAEGRLRVADFGLATAAGLDRLTLSGALVGTPLYLAPEQMRGDAPAPTVDVWGLGVILYEALCGEVPFPAGNLVELMGSLASATQAPSPRAVDDRVPRHLDAVCQRALCIETEGRYPTAQGLADDLQAWLDGDPISASSTRRVPLPVSPRSVLLFALPTLAVGLLGAVVWRGAARAPREAPAPGRETVAARPRASAEPDDRRARERLEQLEGLTDDSALLRGLDAWLAEFPRHPLRERLAARRERLVTRVPLWRLPDEGLTGACFLDEGHVFTWSPRGLRRWPLEGGAPEEWNAEPVVSVGCARGLVAFASRSLLRVWRRDRTPVFERSYADAEHLRSPLTPIRWLVFSPDAGLLAVGGGLDAVDVFHTDDGSLAQRVPLPTGEAGGVCFTPDGLTLLVAESSPDEVDEANRLHCVPLDGGPPTIVPLRGRPTVVTVSSDGAQAFLGFSYGGVQRVDLRHPGAGPTPVAREAEFGLQRGQRGSAHAGRVTGVSLYGEALLSVAGSRGLRTPSGPRAEGGPPRNDLRVWDLPSPLRPRVFLRSESGYSSLDVSPTGVLLGLADTEAQLWHADAFAGARADRSGSSQR